MAAGKDIAEWQRRAVVFYDGACGFCQASVQLVLRYNRRQNLYFASLQSGLAQQLVPGALLPEPLPDSILFYEGGRLYTESEAVLRIARHMVFPFSLLFNFRFVPAAVRNMVYRFVARHRYKIAGRYESCMLPNPQERGRFLA